MNPFFPQLTLTPDASIDLQMHTTNSDGVWTPEQLIDYLVSQHFDLVAITDHERVDTVASVQRLAAQKHLPVLAAVEMSTTWNGNMVDVLCYGFDPQQNALQDLAEPIIREQLENIQEVYAELLRQGFTFPRQHEVLARSDGELRQPIDIVVLIQKHGYAPDDAALEKILGNAGFHWITTDIATVVDAAHRSNAVSLIAHPGRGGGYLRFDSVLLDQLRQEVPIDGLEVYHPHHTPEQCSVYLSYVQAHNLLQSTGSDSHGSPEQMPIKYPAKISRHLLERVGISVNVD